MSEFSDNGGNNTLPRISVIIPHFQMAQALERCLASVKAQKIDKGRFEIIVVDNNSSMFPDEVARKHPDVKFLSEPRPGPGLARNTGASVAVAPLIAFIDADCRAEAGWLQAAISALEYDKNIRIVGGDVRIDYKDDNHLTGIEAYEAVFAYRQSLYIEKLGFSGTGNLATTSATLAVVGPFGGIDIAEDKDWGNRATARGFTIRYVPAMRIYHPARTSFAELQRKWQRHIAHELADRRSSGQPPWRWQLFCIALVLSIPIDSIRLISSGRLNGFANKLRGLAVLARLRLWRARAGIAMARTRSLQAQDYWTDA